MISKSLQSSQISYSTQKQFLYNECKILKRYKPPVSGGFYLLAGPTGFEPAISSVTGRRVRPLHYEPVTLQALSYQTSANCATATNCFRF